MAEGGAGAKGPSKQSVPSPAQTRGDLKPAACGPQALASDVGKGVFETGSGKHLYVPSDDEMKQWGAAPTGRGVPVLRRKTAQVRRASRPL